MRVFFQSNTTMYSQNWALSRLICLCIFIITSISVVEASTLEQAKRLHDRIVGAPASAEVLNQIVVLLDNEQPIEAAYKAMESPHFYSTTLKLFATPWTNEEQDVFFPLNDYSATVIGVIRDDIDFRQILQGDITYIGNGALGLPSYNNNNNDHYQALEDGFINLADELTRSTQSELNGLPSSATAGVLTSRAAAKAFFHLGTNRAMLRFTLMNHLCTDLEPLKDNTLPPDRIRQDVSRSPGGDSRIFLNNCLGCHSGMDPLAQAFAYYDYQFDASNDPNAESGAISYNTTGNIDAITNTRVKAKYHNNATSFPYGFVTQNDQWQNYWRKGINQKLGWDPALSGKGSGIKSLGQELANSQAFAQCQVKKVFKTVCLREAESNADLAQINSTTESFKQNSYQLKRVFAEVGNYCMGE
ncbi:MAG: hypothetical protein OQK09_05290 [Colwellia sp.]|nr:hypothetical protein [Colwellia sp.]MCW8865311.1 hypothetical protein [Colwellia sp.]MCW9080906.1 hypothetical protein [Colwellia sp.]